MAEEVGKGGLQRRRRVFSPVLYRKGKKVFFVVALVKDVPGALANLLVQFKSRLSFVDTSTYRISETSFIFAGSAEALKDGASPDSLKRLASKSPYVLETFVREGREGLILDSFHSGIESPSGERYLLLAAPALANMFHGIKSIFGSGAELVLYEEGHKYGLQRGKSYVSIMGQEKTLTMLDDYSFAYSALGFGVATLLDVGPGELYRVAVEHCFECEEPAGGNSSCPFMRGLVAGVGTVVFDTKVQSSETKCIGRGDTHCEFVLTEDTSEADSDKGGGRTGNVQD